MSYFEWEMNRKVKILQQVLSSIPQEYFVSPAIELGSGSGVLSVACKIICRDLNITAIDKNISNFPLHILKRYNKYGIMVKEGDVLSMEMSTNTFATALMYQFLRHLTEDEQSKLILHVHNILKNEGIFIIVESLLPVYKKSQKNFLRCAEIEFCIDTLLNKKPERHIEYSKAREYLHKAGFLIKQSKKFPTLTTKISQSEWQAWRGHLMSQLKSIPKELKKETNRLISDLEIVEKDIMKEGIEEIPLTLIVCQKIDFHNAVPVRMGVPIIRQEDKNTYLLVNKFANYMLLINKTTLLIYGLCDGVNNINAIVGNIIDKTKADNLKVYEDVKAALMILAEAGFIKFEYMHKF